MSLNPVVQFEILDDLTQKNVDFGYTLEIYKFKFRVIEESIPDYISNHNFLWDFGDGDFSTEVSPTHWYKSPGDFTVKLQLFGINEYKKYTSFANGISKVIHIYNFTPDIDKNSYSDYIKLINVDGLSAGDTYYWNDSPLIKFYIETFNSWQTYELNNGINRIDLNIDQSVYPILKSDVYNNNAYAHLTLSDKFLDLDKQPINSITTSGVPIYITRNLSGDVIYIENQEGATLIGTSAFGEFYYSGNPELSSNISSLNTKLEVSLNTEYLRSQYDLIHNIDNTFEYPIMLVKPYGFNFNNSINLSNLENKLGGYITSNGINEISFNIFEYKYINLPINFVFQYAFAQTNNIYTPILFVDNIIYKDGYLYTDSIRDNSNELIPIGTCKLKDSNKEDVLSSLYTISYEIVQQPDEFDSTKGGYFKGQLIYSGENELNNCYIEVTLDYNLITKELLANSVTINSNYFNILNQSGMDIRKINENFSIYDEFVKDNLQTNLRSLPNLDNFMSTIFGDTYNPNSFTVRIYEKIANYVNNINDIDTCEVESLYSHYYMTNMYITDLNYIYPPNFRRVVDLLSVNMCKLRGYYNYYNLDFDNFGYNNGYYGKNKGKLIDIYTYNITAGVPIIAKEKFSNTYSLINTNLAINLSSNEDKSNLSSIYPEITLDNNGYIYPLKYYRNDIQTASTYEISNIGWGWGLILPEDDYQLSSFYEFYEYIPNTVEQNVNSIIDFNNSNNSIPLTAFDTTWQWNKIKLKYISQNLYNNLII